MSGQTILITVLGFSREMVDYSCGCIVQFSLMNETIKTLSLTGWYMIDFESVLRIRYLQSQMSLPHFACTMSPS